MFLEQRLNVEFITIKKNNDDTCLYNNQQKCALFQQHEQ